MRPTLVLVLALCAALCSAQWLGASWVRVEPDDSCFSYVSARNSLSHYCQIVNACNSTVFVYPVEAEPSIHVEVDLLNLECAPYSVDAVRTVLRKSVDPFFDYTATALDYCVDVSGTCCRHLDVHCNYGQFCNTTLSCNGKTAGYYMHMTTELY